MNVVKCEKRFPEALVACDVFLITYVLHLVLVLQVDLQLEELTSQTIMRGS